MAEWTAIWGVIGAFIFATVLSSILALFPLISNDRRIEIWQQYEFEHQVNFWRALQEEIMTEISRTQRIPPPPQREPDPQSAIPPLYLYHGTNRSSLASIIVRGIEGRSGGWAFSARDYGTAREYGQRWGGEYVVLRILAQQAYQNGVYFETRGAYLVTRHIHPAYIDIHWTIAELAQNHDAPALSQL